MKTLLMIKPDAVAEGHVGEILALVEKSRFGIRRLTMTQFSRERAERFYAVHRERPFFKDLVAYITSGPVVAIDIEAEEAVSRIREFIGADSLGYLSIPGVLAAIELPYERFCFACFDGRYPEPVPYDAASRKFILEEEPVSSRG